MMMVVVSIFLLVCLYLGIKGAGEVKSLKEFALGGKKISTAALVLTIYATHLGAGSTLGVIEQINNIGIICVVMTIGDVLRWYITRAIFCNNVARFDGCLSQAHVMEKLYGPLGLWLTNLVTLVSSIGVVAIQVMVIGFIAQYFMGLSSTTSIILGSAVVALYSASGGVKAVILTDIIQAILFFIVIISIFFLSIQVLGAHPEFSSSIPKSKAWIIPYDWHSFLLVIGMVTYSLVPIGGDSPMVQRILISGSKEQLYKAFSNVALTNFMVMLAITFIAVLLMPITGEGTLSKLDIFQIMSSNMHPALVGATVIGLLAITMSTADSWLNAGAVTIAHDIAKTLKSDLTNVQQIKVARLATLFLGIISVCLACMGNSVLSVLLMIMCFQQPLISIPIAAGFLGYKVTPLDFKRSVFGAIIGVLFGSCLEWKMGFISLLFGLIGSAIGLAWRKKWTFRLPDGSPIIPLPEYRKITPMFLLLVMGLGLVHMLLHCYVDQVWLVGDMALPACITAIICGLLLLAYNNTTSKIYYYCPNIATFFLIASLSSFAFRTGNPFSTGYLVGTILIVLVYRQYWAALYGITLGFASLNFYYIIAYSPVVPISAIVAGILVLGIACVYIMLKETKYQLEYEKTLSNTDALTGLYNRRYMDCRLEELLQHSLSRGKELSVIMFDIDHFKPLNDTYGHKAGDAILTQLGLRIRKNARPSDVCTRYGGEEFVILMPDTNLQQADIVAERIRRAVEIGYFAVPVKPYRLECTISVGVTSLQPSDTAHTIIARVDAALYDAKEQGRNQIVTASQVHSSHVDTEQGQTVTYLPADA